MVKLLNKSQFICIYLMFIDIVATHLPYKLFITQMNLHGFSNGSVYQSRVSVTWILPVILR
jgi:hypothetical protein